MKIHKLDDKITCPTCDEVQDDEGGGASDFVTPGKIGNPSASDHECIYCFEPFTVTKISEDQIEVI